MKNRLIAHRGDMTTYPENTLLALTKAAKLGYLYLELDVQFSKDLTPFVIHDDNLLRTIGVDKNVYQCSTKELLSHRVLATVNDVESNVLLNLATLEKTVEVLNQYPDITLFVEVKKHCLDHFDLDRVVDIIFNDVKEARFNIVIISFVKEVIEYASSKGSYRTGWVLSQYDQVHQAIANELQPEYLFCNVEKINHPSELWQGPWKWALYDVLNPEFAYELLEQGVDMIETGDIVKLSSSEHFQ